MAKLARKLVVIVSIVLALAGCAKRAVSPDPVANESLPEVEVPSSPVTGKPLLSEGSPVAVSIGNNSGARLQSGLSQADVVYEVLAEGGITRYLAIFHSQAPSKVGPIRSARPYLVLLAKEWGAIFGHCGGDPKDLEPIREWKVVDADEFARGDLYWRDRSRVAPNNLYTSVENLRKASSETLQAPEKRYEFTSWAEEPRTGIRIDYGFNYRVEYRYSSEHEAYERYVIDGGRELRQEELDTQDPVLVSNVIVQVAQSRVAYSDGGLIIDLIGEGEAQYLLGGRWEEGTWKKDGVEEPTLFFYDDGDPIEITPGQTWVQIVPRNAKISLLD